MQESVLQNLWWHGLSGNCSQLEVSGRGELKQARCTVRLDADSRGVLG